MKSFAALLSAFFAFSSQASDARPSPIAVAEAFLNGLQSKNLPAMSRLMADDVQLKQPLTLTPKPSEFNGRAEVEPYIGRVMGAFERISFKNLRFTEAKEGISVFVQMDGDFVVAGSGKAYQNTYVMRLEMRLEGQEIKVTKIEEYFNPIVVGCALSPDLAAFCQSIGR
jgi:uncharacterized protein